MTQYISIHPDNPQARLVSQVVVVLRQGGVIVYPTDSCYAMGCLAEQKTAIERIRRIRQLGTKHNMTLVCQDLSDIGVYAKLNNIAFRFIKRLTPGPYTFLLKASKDVPRHLQHPQKRTIGLRIPDNRIALALLEALGEAMLSTSLIFPGGQLPETDPETIREKLEGEVDLIIDAGAGGLEPTSVLDLITRNPQIIREGKGDVSILLD